MVFYGYASTADELRTRYLEQDYEVLSITARPDGTFLVTYFMEVV